MVRVAETSVGFVRAGLGIAVLDEFTAMDAASDAVAVRPLEVGSRFSLYLPRALGVLDLSRRHLHGRHLRC